MDYLTIIIVTAIVVILAVFVMGIFSAFQGDKFDRQMKLARIASDTLTFLLLAIALYLLV